MTYNDKNGKTYAQVSEIAFYDGGTGYETGAQVARIAVDDPYNLSELSAAIRRAGVVDTVTKRETWGYGVDIVLYDQWDEPRYILS